MSKTKIAGLGVVVLVVVALTGCDIFGVKRGPGFGYREIKPPVDRAVDGTVYRSSSISIASNSTVSASGQTPQGAAQAEYERMSDILDFIDEQMNELDNRARDNAPACVTDEPKRVEITVPDMKDATETLVAFIQCKETLVDSEVDIPNNPGQKSYHYSVYFGSDQDNNTFYLIEVAEQEDTKGGKEVREHRFSYAKHDRNIDRVTFHSFGLQNMGAGATQVMSANWAAFVMKIDARPNAGAGDEYRFFGASYSDQESSGAEFRFPLEGVNVEKPDWNWEVGAMAGFLVPELLQVTVPVGGGEEVIGYHYMRDLFRDEIILKEDNPSRDGFRPIGEIPAFSFGDHVDELGTLRLNDGVANEASDWRMPVVPDPSSSSRQGVVDLLTKVRAWSEPGNPDVEGVGSFSP